ncbi:TPM domain-containing protein [Microcoleus sp.]|uniref:TPM domain-containing protein n=1 Tax=Microcoleus sp. TaxID=44472 RepID=UPI00403E656D
MLCFWAIAFPVTSQAITVQKVPNLRQVNNTWVTEKANILSDSTEIHLNQMISDLEAKNGSEIAVVTVLFFLSIEG